MTSELTGGYGDRAPVQNLPAIPVPGMRLVAELGRGATSVVYRAELDGQGYAVKVLTRDSESAEGVAFIREAALSASLRHPGLVAIHEAGQFEGRPYIVMELINGQPLSRIIRDRTLDGRAAATLGAELAGILGVAHSAGLVHRDVKPDNILIEANGRARLIDLGLAARAGGRAGDDAAGTFRYSAPEQTGMLRRPVDGRADLYALGVVLYECLTGQPPFQATDAGELVRAHLLAPVPDVRDVRPEVGESLAAVVRRLMAKDPDDRYASAEQARQQLGRLADDEHIGAGPPPLPTVGRADESAELRSVWAAALAGDGGAALVTGAAGLGAGRLVAEVAAQAADRGHPVLRGATSEDNRTPMAPLRDAVERHLTEVAALPEPGRSRAVASVREAAGSAAGLLAQFAPTLRGLLGDNAAPATAKVDEDRFAEAVTGYLLRLADLSGGAVLLLNDAQWWDDSTRAVLSRLATALADRHLFLLVSARDDAAAAVIAPALRAHIRLRPLSPAEVAALVTSALGGGIVPESLTDRLASRSDGNPLAVNEYVRAALDGGVLMPSWGRWVVDEAGLDRLQLPADVIDLMLRRVRHLGPAAQDLLVVAAGIGMRFAPDLAATVLAQWVTTPSDALDAITEALAHHLIEPVDAQFSFVHERIREALLSRLDDAGRRRLHQLIAEAMRGTDADVYAVAQHYLNGETDQQPARLIDAATAAGQRALSEYAPTQAYLFFQRAEEAATRAGSEPDAAFHAAYGMAAVLVGEPEVAQHQVRQALATEPDPAQRGLLYAWLAESHHVQWEGLQAVEMARRGLAEIGRPVPENRSALLLTSVGRQVWAGLLEAMPAPRRPVTGERRVTDQIEVRLLTTIRQSAAYALQMPLVGLMSMRSSVIAARLGPGPESVDARTSAAMAAAAVGRHKRSRQLFTRAFAEAAELADPVVTARVNLMYALHRDASEAPEATTGRTFKATLANHGQWLPASDYLLLAAQLGLYELMRGHLDEATTWYERACRRVSATASYGNPIMALGASVAALGADRAAALTRLSGVRAFAAADSGNIATQVNAALTATQVALELGRPGAAFDDAVADFRSLGLAPRRMFPVQRTFWIFQAYGRLAQAGAASGSVRPAAMTAAGSAVAELRQTAAGSLYGAFATVAEAWLDHLSERPHEALRRLASLDASTDGHNSALVDFEAARVRTRVLTGLGRTEEAQRHARSALALATDYGWRARATWVRDEFESLADGTMYGPAAPASHRYSDVAAKSHLRRLEAVHQVSVAASAVLDPRQLCRVALDESLKILAGERAVLFVVDPATDQLVPFLGRDAHGADLETPAGYGASLVQRVRDTAEPLVVTGGEQGVALGSRSSLVYGLRSIIAAPVQLRDRLRGVIYLDSRVARGIFTTDDVEILAAIAHQVAVTFETADAARLESDMRTARRERDLAEMLRRANIELSDTLDPDDVIERMITVIGRTAPVHSWSLLHQRNDGTVTVLGGGAAGSAVDSTDFLRRVLDLGDPQHGTSRTGVAGHLGADTRAWMALPLLSRGERRVLLLGSTEPNAYTDGATRIAAALAGQGLTAYENALLFRQVGELASRDALTGLFNRRHFVETAGDLTDPVRRRSPTVAAVMVDIDFFKQINDTHGHGVGDQVIREVAGRLARCLRADDIICRYGGEEYAILLAGVSAEQSDALAQRLHSAVRDTPIDTEAGPLDVTVSVGVTASSRPEATVQTLLHQADLAMYSAKRAGRDRVSSQ